VLRCLGIVCQQSIISQNCLIAGCAHTESHSQWSALSELPLEVFLSPLQTHCPRRYYMWFFRYKYVPLDQLVINEIWLLSLSSSQVGLCCAMLSLPSCVTQFAVHHGALGCRFEGLVLSRLQSRSKLCYEKHCPLSSSVTSTFTTVE
jgi:hypothetical protein